VVGPASLTSGPPARANCFFFQAEDGIRYWSVTGVQTCALPIYDPNIPADLPWEDRPEIWSMLTELRRTGIQVVGDVPWGTHLCHFYKTREELVDILLPYFCSGLASNECCVWVVPDETEQNRARDALRRTVPNLDEHEKRGDI